jgi:hypothetical protein
MTVTRRSLYLFAASWGDGAIQGRYVGASLWE